MRYRHKAFWSWLGRKVRAHFLTGILTMVPFIAAAWILYKIFTTIDGILQPIIEPILGRTIPGVGFGITILLVYLAGVFASNVIGRWLIHRGEAALPWMPIFRQLYTGIKQILESFSAPSSTGFMQVVFVEFPRKGMRVIGFVTNELSDESGKKLFTVFVPTSPNPTSGFLQIVAEDDIVPAGISVDNALKMVVSAGRVVPPGIIHTLSGIK